MGLDSPASQRERKGKLFPLSPVYWSCPQGPRKRVKAQKKLWEPTDNLGSFYTFFYTSWNYDVSQQEIPNFQSRPNFHFQWPI